MKCFLKVKMFLIKVSYPIKSQQQKMKQLGGELVKYLNLWKQLAGPFGLGRVAALGGGLTDCLLLLSAY